MALPRAKTPNAINIWGRSAFLPCPARPTSHDPSRVWRFGRRVGFGPPGGGAARNGPLESAWRARRRPFLRGVWRFRRSQRRSRQARAPAGIRDSGCLGGSSLGPGAPFRGPFLPRLWRFGLEELGCVLDALPGWGAGFRALGKPRNRRRGVRQRAELSPTWHFCPNAGVGQIPIRFCVFRVEVNADKPRSSRL